MNRRNALYKMFGCLMAWFGIYTSSPLKQREYSLSEIEQARHLHIMLAKGVYENKIKHYTATFTKQKTIIFTWSDL